IGASSTIHRPTSDFSLDRPRIVFFIVSPFCPDFRARGDYRRSQTARQRGRCAVRQRRTAVSGGAIIAGESGGGFSYGPDFGFVARGNNIAGFKYGGACGSLPRKDIKVRRRGSSGGYKGPPCRYFPGGRVFRFVWRECRNHTPP